MKSQRFSLFFTKLITVPRAVATRRASPSPCWGGRPLVTSHLGSYYLDPVIMAVIRIIFGWQDLFDLRHEFL